ncbi:hypothetical protein JJB07_09355 [Tumebacillus sp. ITR2]|uniref:Uncharacterized protein n=1 Tax=Tumebacillus amylolyticus TaxID=2801339 RepID=A0ABS1J9A9_9BACL|nr:hypothetical protein [Tumebacillus amylolyticus]MBL0386858.1 hypothetical protein [Tumebacillus amylolyticus]
MVRVRRAIGITLMIVGLVLAGYLAYTYWIEHSNEPPNTPAPPEQNLPQNNAVPGVPSSWKSTQTGNPGIWSGVDYTNPADANQKVSYVYSLCMGCVMDPDQFAKGQHVPSPLVALPSDALDKREAEDHMSATYTLYTKPYPTYGIIKVEKDERGDYKGYSTLEVTLPPSDQALGRKILNGGKDLSS